MTRRSYAIVSIELDDGRELEISMRSTFCAGEPRSYASGGSPDSWDKDDGEDWNVDGRTVKPFPLSGEEEARLERAQKKANWEE